VSGEAAATADRSARWLALTPLVPLVALVPGGRWLAPLVAPLPLWPAFSAAVRVDRRGRAFAFGLLWALLLSVSTIALTQAAPRAAGRGIWNAEPYRLEMFRWIETGIGKEVEPARFLPEHALHLGAFALLSLASGGYLGLVLGAALLAYMNYFVGAFALSSGLPCLGALAAWVPWALVRVVAFVALGSILARPLLVGRSRALDSADRRWLAWAFAGVLADAALKTLLAPAYGLWLRRLLGDG
jgi:hypothetical protein